jgi:hypothetical protein
MFLRFGKHRGKSMESLALKEPDYCVWMLSEDQGSYMLGEARQELFRLIRRFDKKPILEPCEGCGDTATRGTLYHGSAAPHWFCDDCNPYDLGASSGKLVIVSTFADAVAYVGSWCNGRRDALKALILALARAKGLPARVGESEAQAFFR